nr:MAG TPA: hypothetical protein [Caudoviricetes sp.]
MASIFTSCSWFGFFRKVLNFTSTAMAAPIPAIAPHTLRIHVTASASVKANSGFGITAHLPLVSRIGFASFHRIISRLGNTACLLLCNFKSSLFGKPHNKLSGFFVLFLTSHVVHVLLDIAARSLSPFHQQRIRLQHSKRTTDNVSSLRKNILAKQKKTNAGKSYDNIKNPLFHTLLLHIIRMHDAIGIVSQLRLLRFGVFSTGLMLLHLDPGVAQVFSAQRRKKSRVKAVVRQLTDTEAQHHIHNRVHNRRTHRKHNDLF